MGNFSSCPQDQHLHNFFLHCQQVESGGGLAIDMNNVNKIKVSTSNLHLGLIEYLVSWWPAISVNCKLFLKESQQFLKGDIYEKCYLFMQLNLK